MASQGDAWWSRAVLSDSLTLTEASLAASIDHTALKPDTTKATIDTLCAEAVTFGFGCVCVAPIWVRHACAALASLKSSVHVKVASVVGFPHGTSLPETKALEARLAVLQGAREIDMVLDASALKAGAEELLDVSAVVRAVSEVERELNLPRDSVLVKVIFETALLNDVEKVRACTLSERAGAHMVKTSTGFASSGATVADVSLMRRSVGTRVGVKASGGIRSLDDAVAMLRAGASRLGCSAGVQIVQQWRAKAQESIPLTSNSGATTSSAAHSSNSGQY